METGTHGSPPQSRGLGATDEMKEKASELTRSARGRAMSTLDQQKDQLCGLLDRVSTSMEGDRVGGYAAEYARRGAGYLREHSSDEIFTSLRSQLRSRPGVLLGACFFAGLAVARVLKGGGEDRHELGGGDAWRDADGWRADAEARLRAQHDAGPGWTGDQP